MSDIFTQRKRSAVMAAIRSQGNKARDRHVNRALRGRGWVVVRVWGHELAPKFRSGLLKRLRSLRRAED